MHTSSSPLSLSRRSFVAGGLVAALAAAGLVSLVGEVPAARAADDAATRTVVDARGEVEIPADPQRIVDLSGNSDMLAILGYEVVGTANSDAYDYTVLPSYLAETLEGATILGYSMQDTMDIEAILELDPDLVIISTVQEKMYDQLQTLAPTIMIELAQIDWKEDIAAFAEVMDAQDEADAWLAAYEEKALATGDAIKELYGEDTTYLAFLASGGQLYIFDAAGIGMVMYEDMGLAKPAGMPEQENISLPVVDYEGLAQIDADVLVAVGTDADLEALNASKLYQGMRAVQDGNVVELPASPYFNEGYSCLGKELFVGELPYLLAGETPEEAVEHARADAAAEADADDAADDDADAQK
jgi:iron complex transport system substrate-binding protein